MQENQWGKIEEIFNRAAALPVAERREFVEEVCVTEPELCREIISLIDNDCLEDSFLDEPIFSLGAHLLDNDFSDFLAAGHFGFYKLQKLLGRGGMGAVFLAEDERLGRLVALKILPTAFADDEKMVERFRQEARLASSISHPNVAHIYEFSQQDGRYFLAMEYVRGETLRELIKQQAIEAGRAIEISLQIAEALGAAHKIGIVHQDIKPENVMATEEGLVKVLDFGISKMTAQRLGTSESGAEDQVASNQTSGALRGTIAYMSPEQLSGHLVDERTDLWSLGVVLYEMLMGKRPFEDITFCSIQGKILVDEPADSIQPALLSCIVQKTLRKNKFERYQTAADFAADLRSAQLKLKVSSPEKNTTPRPFLFAFSKPVTLFAAIVIMLLSGWMAFQYFGKPADSIKLTARKSIRLNLTSKARSAALSSSGNWLAYAFEEEGKIFLVLKPNDTQVNSAATEKILVESSATRIAGLAFSPDEQLVYFTLYEADKIYADLYRVSVNGGEPQKVLSKIENAPSFSPDGKQIVFLRLGEDESHESLIVADADGRNERILHTRRMPEYITHLATPAWSPDGTTILCAAGRYGAGKRQEVFPVKINVADAQATPVFDEPWHEIWQTAWLGDGKFFVMVGRKKSADINKQLWQVNSSDGTVFRITDDFNDYFGLSVAAQIPDNNIQIGTLVLDRATDLWITEANGKSDEARQITSNADNSYGISWGSTNRIIYGSVAGNNHDIWSINPDGQQRQQITFDPARDSFPTFSADSSHIFFISERDGVKSLWRVNQDGSESVLMVKGVSTQPFTVSPDGRWLYFHSYFSGAAALWRVSTGGGEPEKIADGTLENPAIAPDNKTVAAVWKNEEGNSKLAVFNSETPARENWRTFNFFGGANPASASSPTALRWTTDGKAIAYVVQQKGVGNIWAQFIDGETKQLTNFTTARIWSFDFSPDCKQIVCSRGDQQRFVTLLQLDEAK